MKKAILFSLIVFACSSWASPPSDKTNSVFLDLLYWQLRDGSAENWAQEISPAGTSRNAKLLSVPFNWSPGLRIGIGHSNCDGLWDIIFSYTFFQTKGESQATTSSGGIYSPFLGNFFINNRDGSGISGPIYQNASIRWKVLFNIADCEVGRTIIVDDFFKLRPFIGLKAGFINHDIRSTWQNPTIATTFTSATENLKNDFCGVGPSIGFNTTLGIYKEHQNSINLVANISGSLLWGHWRFKDLYSNNTPASVAVHLRSITGAASMSKGFLGVEWVGYMGGANIAVHLGYEAQVWFHQVQYYSFNMGRLNNLMSMHGGVLGFNFYF